MSYKSLLFGTSILILFQSCQKRTTNIFDKGRNYTYSAIYINPAGDTLTREIIELIPKARPWFWQWSQRTFKIVYKPDTANLLEWNNPLSRRQNFSENLRREKNLASEPWTGIWEINKRTGVTENERGILIHPFRSNQYVYTEIAPFPFVLFSNLQSGESYYSWINVGKGWGEFSGRAETIYTVADSVAFELKGDLIQPCWLVKSVEIHPKLGNNYNNFIFNKEYGFLQMDYSFYNGVQIQFKLIEVSGT